MECGMTKDQRTKTKDPDSSMFLRKFGGQFKKVCQNYKSNKK